MNAAGLATAEIPKFLNADWSFGKAARPILFLTINNGAAHTRAAEAIARAWQKINRDIPTRVIEVSAFMSPLARFTHITAYLWLVKNAPRVWEKIDAYQKRQTRTSPEWFYRRECRKLFELVEQIQPAAIVTTEVGCGEIAALIKRDLQLNAPLVAVSLDYDADRAWIQPEVDFYCTASERVRESFIKSGMDAEKIGTWGVPLEEVFAESFSKETARHKVCEWLNLPENAPLILVAGGGEGLGKIKEIAARLLEIKFNKSIVVLTGRNQKLKRECERLAEYSNDLKILDWTERVSELFRAADILVSKLGITFEEACACGLPVVALPPPPGAERAQYDLLEKNGIGRAVKTVEEAGRAVEQLLADKQALAQMSLRAKAFSRADAASKIAGWLAAEIV